MDHAVFWISALGALNLAVLAALAIDALPARIERALASVAACCGHLVLARMMGLGLWQIWGGLAWPGNPPAPSKTAAAVARDLERVLRARGTVRPLVRIEQETREMTAGVLRRLHTSGFAARVDDDWAVAVSSPLHRDGHQGVDVRLVGPAEHARLMAAGRPAISEHALLLAHLAL